MGHGGVPWDVSDLFLVCLWMLVLLVECWASADLAGGGLQWVKGSRTGHEPLTQYSKSLVAPQPLGDDHDLAVLAACDPMLRSLVP